MKRKTGKRLVNGTKKGGENQAEHLPKFEVMVGTSGSDTWKETQHNYTAQIQ